MDLEIGDKIMIITMVGEKKYQGRTGVVQYKDGIGQYFGTWGGLAIDPKVDTVIRWEEEDVI